MSGQDREQRPLSQAAFAADRWKEIEPLLDELLDAHGAQRAAVLERVATTDPALRDAVEMLLKSYDQSGDFLEEPAQVRAGPLLIRFASADMPIAEQVRIGPYRVVGEIGRGGMGAVYLAERDDGVFSKRVALKILPPAWALDDELLRRFQEERQILASLEHPGIASIIDGGVTGEGVPYFIMEYIDGAPIDRYSDDLRLGIEPRLELFCACCDAVQYAHNKHVVHRDLKPSNILVTPEARVKLLDFGIAKMLTVDAGTEVTQPGNRFMTPEFASPEQVLGRPVSPASDVYSLGVLLYRLLTGHLPYTIPGHTPRQIEQCVLRGNPPPPSEAGKDRDRPRRTQTPAGTLWPGAEDPARLRGTSHAQLSRRLRGDLDAIVLKALEKDPAARYASAGELAEDLRRHLKHEPVRATRSGLASRAWRIGSVRRRWLAAAALMLAVITVARMWTRQARATTTLPPQTVIAVLPFVPTDSDTTLLRLGRDLAVTLSTTLDGVGALRAIDPIRALALDARDSRGSESPRELAQRLGAGAIVRGALVRTGDQVRADAVLMTGDGTATLARASATTALGDLPALSDSIAWSLLRQVWRGGTPPTPRLDAVTTRSIPALRAYLAGEQFLAESRFQEAIRAFAAAIENDSSFAYAYWRFALASSQLDRPVEPEIVARYMAARNSFPERDRLQIEAETVDTLAVRLARLRELSERFRDDGPAQWNYADRLVHDGSLLGYTYAETQAALERAAALNPQMHAAWQHILWVAGAEGDTAAARRAFRELARLRSSLPGNSPQSRELALFRYVLHLMQAGGSVDPQLADSMAANMVAVSTAIRSEGISTGLLLYGFPAASVDLHHRVLRLSPAEPFAGSVRRGLAASWAARGAWDSAVVIAGRDRAGMSAEVALHTYRLAVIGLWEGEINRNDLPPLRGRLAGASERLAPGEQAELAWLDGVAAAAIGDREALAEARSALRRTDRVTALLLDPTLVAFEQDLRGDRAAAARTLQAAERARTERYGLYRRGSGSPYLTAVNRLTASRWLLELGDTAAASALLVFHEGVPAPMAGTATANRVMAGPAYLERARIAEALGRHEVARKMYWQFLRRYDMPGGAHQQSVRDARAAYARLRSSD